MNECLANTGDSITVIAIVSAGLFFSGFVVFHILRKTGRGKFSNIVSGIIITGCLIASSSAVAHAACTSNSGESPANASTTKLGRVTNFRASPVKNSPNITLEWDYSGASPSSFIISRDGEVLGTVSGRKYIDVTSQPSHTYTYSIAPKESSRVGESVSTTVTSTNIADVYGTISSKKLTANNVFVENGGLMPSLTDGVLTTGVNTSNAAWRSEIAWATDNESYLRLARGSTVTEEFDVKFNNVGNLENTNFSVFYQLIGPIQYHNTWPGPPVALVAENNEIRLSGGYAVPTGQVNGDGSVVYTAQNGYTLHSGVVADNGSSHHIKISTLLDGPNKGAVSVWIDGDSFVYNYKPAAGTFYTVPGEFTQQWAIVKNGLYGGQTNPPSTGFSDNFSNIRLTIAEPNGVTTYYTE